MKYFNQSNIAMNKKTVIILSTLLMLFMFSACDDPNGENEESGTQYTKIQTVDETLNGAHLLMTYDEPSNSFNGTVENTTSETLEQARVEIHLSNGTELGPTTPFDMVAGTTMDVRLQATSTDWETWSVHPESGSSEGDGGENHGAGDGD